jgi:hypothetical protein
MSKLTRVSRKVNPATLVAVPGVWLSIDATGIASNVQTSTAPLVAKLCIGSNSANPYESHDVEVGRITTLETIGVRCGVDSDGFHGSSITQGALLSVDTSAGYEGQLKAAVKGDVAVAVAEGYDSATGVLTFTTCSPIVTLAA